MKGKNTVRSRKVLSTEILPLELLVVMQLFVNNKMQQVSNGNDETRNSISDKVSELSVPETGFDRQTHTHHMVTGQTVQTNQSPEFLTGRILTPREPHHTNIRT